MNTLPLPRDAENIRKGIKEMIPETTTLSAGDLPGITAEIRDDGNKTYLGKTLAEKISLLTKEMHIGDVRTPFIS
jgi:hypothetical protein